MNLTFREGTCDFNVAYDVLVRNQYELPALTSDSVVVDIGAHIGSFSALAYNKGSRNIYAFEANKENYQIAKEHLKQYEGAVVVFNKAVWKPHVRLLHHSGFLYDNSAHELNTGGGNVFALDGEEVHTISLDAIITEISGTIDYLKLDCEGSEFPILATCTQLDKISHIMVEYHEMQEIPEMARTEQLPDYTIGALTDFLRWHDFTRTKEYRHGVDSNLGMAWFTK